MGVGLLLLGRDEELTASFKGNDVTVVIPTIGRSTLRESIESVINQDEPVAKILVIDDSTKSDIPDFSRFPNVVVLQNTGYRGGNWARQLGINHCDTELIMFLDDDDVWEKDKVSKQLHDVNVNLNSTTKAKNSWISFTKLKIMKSDGEKTNKVVPYGQISSIENLELFLTERYSVIHGPGVIPFSSLCTPISLFREHPLECNLAFHQDLTWLITLSRKISPLVIGTEKPCVNFRQGLDRVSTSPDFASIAVWCEKYLLPSSKVVAGNYILSYALQVIRSQSNSSVREMFKVLKWSYKHTKPSRNSYAYAITWILVTAIGLDSKLDRRRG
jgi:glycosyltransferase involved in cell wall biosynthesis